MLRVASRLTSFTSVLHPQGLIPLDALNLLPLTVPQDVTDVEPVSTDVNAVCEVLKTGDEGTLALKSSTCLFIHMT